MKKNFNAEETAATIRTSADTLVDDIEENNFVSGATVSWLAHKPSTLAEAAENLYERLRTIGVTVSVDRKEFVEKISRRNGEDYGPEDIGSSAYWVSLDEEWTASFDSEDIDRQDIGEAAFLRSDYRKQNQ